MGVHHAWGRTYKDAFCRFHAMLGEDQTLAERLRLPGPLGGGQRRARAGFTSKKDIEAYGIADFVRLCKQRVLTYAAVQTEQSIRLGYWMDWNDPDELRRLRDLLGEDPTQVITVEGPRGPVTDTVEMLVGRLGLPELGGSYFTFSNENNDLIWGFLAEVHRRGWLYKGIDSMPWCARCGTGMSQMEMNEGYQDREDPGLTVRFPLVDRPGEWLLVWTTTPWTMTANVAAAVGPDLDYVLDPPGRGSLLGRQGDAEERGPGTVRGARGAQGLGPRRAGAIAGPFDDLDAVRTAFANGVDAEGAAPYRHRVIPWNDVGEDEGTGIVHIAPGGGADDFRLGKNLGLPVIAPLDESGHYLPGFGPFSGTDVAGVTGEIIEALQARGFFYHLEPYTHRYPHCWRCGTALVFRVVDEWYISMGPVYDVPRAQVTPEQKAASLRYQIMDVVDRIRWIPGFGYERELDWLHTMSDWMISKKRYWGLALPIWECGTCEAFEVVGGREELGARAARGFEALEGRTQHRPWVDEVVLDCRACGGEMRRIADVGNPWLDAGIVPFSTLHYPERPRSLAEVVPGRLHHRVVPGPVPQLVLLDARDGHGPAERAALPDDLRLRDALRRGRPSHAQELGQRDRVQRGGRAHGRGRHALDVLAPAARGQHPLRLPHRRRGSAGAAGPVERAGLLQHVRPTDGLAAGPRDGRVPRRPIPAGASSTAGSCRAQRRPRQRRRRASPTTTPALRPWR